MGRIICIGVFVFFAFSCFENIGMTMGIMPVTGIPLRCSVTAVFGVSVLHGRWPRALDFARGPAIRLNP